MKQWKKLTRDPRSLERYRESLTAHDKPIHSFLEIDPVLGSSLSASDKSGPLAGIPFSIKDNIALEGFSYTCGSKILEPLRAPYSATAVKRLLDAGAVPAGKTNLDEFGMGSSTEQSGYGNTRNAWNLEMVPGGSSGGSAASVAAGLVPFSLGSDTGGSVRQPAAFCGIYGFKPTYGRVSRYGLAAYASSLETIGILSADLNLLRRVFSQIQGPDVHDQTTRSSTPLTGNSDVPTVAVLSRVEGLSDEVQWGYDQTLEAISRAGWNIRKFDLASLEYAVSAYYTIAMAEASSNLARYTGIRYGLRSEHAASQEEMVRRTRDEGFGQEVKLRILLGTYVLRSGFQEQYYVKAQKIRTLIKQELQGIFNGSDVIMMPVFPVQAFKIGSSGLSSMQQKVADRYTLLANLAGCCAVSFPCGVASGLPVGMQLLAPGMADELLLDRLEELMRYLPGVTLPKPTLAEVIHD